MAVVQYEAHFPPLLYGYLLFEASKWIESDWNKLCSPRDIYISRNTIITITGLATPPHQS